MSTLPPGFDRQDALLQGVLRTIQALTAVLYRASHERDALERQLKVYLDEDNSEMPEDLQRTAQLPLQAALNVIAEIKAAQSPK